MSYHSPQLIPLRANRNFAPLEPLLRLSEAPAKTHYVCDAIKERFSEYIKREDSTRRELIAAGELVGHMIQGDSILERDRYSDSWIVLHPKKKDGSAQRAINFMQYFCDAVATKLHSSNPDVICQPTTNTEKSRQAAKGSAAIVDFYEKRWYRGWYAIQETLNLMTYGTSISRIRHDAQVPGAKVLRSIIENKSVTLGDGAGYCGACEYSGAGTEFQGVDEETQQQAYACPQCGSNAVTVQPPATAEMPTVVGTEEINLGEFVLDLMPFPGCWWDLRVRPEESDWFIYQRRIGLAHARSLLGNVAIGDGEQDIGLDALDRLAFMGQAVDGRARADRTAGWINKAQVNVAEFWLSPEDLLDITIKGDERTVGGQTLPGGKKLAEAFPKGAVAVGLNGFKHLLGLYGECHRETIASCVFHARPNSGAGRGVQDMVEVQKRFNRLDSQQLDYLDAAATPASIYDPEIIQADDAEYLGTPRANIPANLRMLPESRSLSDAVHQLQPMSPAGAIVQYTQQFLTQAFTTTSHAVSVANGGMVNNRNETAHGAAIAEANANSLVQPMLLPRAGQRQRIAELLVPLYAEQFPIEREFVLGGKYGRAQGIAIKGSDLLDAEVIFEVVPGSELTESSITKQFKLKEYYGMFGDMPTYMLIKQQEPEFVAHLEREFNVAQMEGGYDVAALVCERRLGQLKQFAGIGIFDPVILNAALDMPFDPAADMMLQQVAQQLNQLLQPPVITEEPQHPQKRQWFQAWLDEDEGQEAEPLLRGLVRLMIRQHFKLDGAQQTAVALQQSGLQSIMQPPEEEGGAEGKGNPPAKKKEKKEVDKGVAA